MKPVPYPGPGVVGAGAGHPPDALFPEAELSRRLATLAAEAGLAFCAMAANRTVQGQVRLAHAIAGQARAQCRSIVDMGEWAIPPGAAREAALGSVHLVAELSDRLADQLAESANAFGRAFGHLAFAFPVHDRSD